LFDISRKAFHEIPKPSDSPAMPVMVWKKHSSKGGKQIAKVLLAGGESSLRVTQSEANK
jgi:hypothetical protein